MTSNQQELLYRPGLEGIIAGETAISNIDDGLRYPLFGVQFFSHESLKYGRVLGFIVDERRHGFLDLSTPLEMDNTHSERSNRALFHDQGMVGDVLEPTELALPNEILQSR